MSRPLELQEILELLLSREYRDKLTDEQAIAFEGMLSGGSGRFLTPNQTAWIRGVADRLGIQTSPSENLWSALSPEERRRQRAAAAKVKLPWEK